MTDYQASCARFDPDDPTHGRTVRGGLSPDIELGERICTENNGPHGTVALTNARCDPMRSHGVSYEDATPSQQAVAVTLRVACLGVMGAVSVWLSMLASVEAAQSSTRPYQMSILGATETLNGAGVDIPIFTQNVYAHQGQPAGHSIAWLPPDPNLDRHTIDWSRIVAVYVDEPYGEILKNLDSCAGTPSPIADIMATLEAMAAAVRARAPQARFWVNFTRKEIDLMRSATANCPLNQPYIDVISMDIYGVAFGPALRDRYDYLYAHRATSAQQLALVPGTFTGGWEKQSGRQGAARLKGFFAYAARMNRQCNLPLGPRGVTGTYDGCPVWIVAGWWGGTTPVDANPRDYFPIEHSASTLVLKAWRRQFAVPRVDPSRLRPNAG